MINVNDFKTGMTIKYEGNLYQVLEFQHVKPGKGAAFVRTKLKNLKSGSTIEITFNSSIKVESARVDKETMQFLYSQGNTYYFMNMETYDQIEIDKNVLGEDAKFLKESLEVYISFYEGQVLGIILPDKISYLITKADPGVKGNTTSTAMKDAEIETGMIIKVPMFVNEGDTVLVATSDGKYVSRA